MALWHTRVKVIKRSQGQSAPHAAAYRAGARIFDERTGRTLDYQRKRHVEHTEIMAPEGAPEWVQDRQTLWNLVEKTEKRKDAQLAREVELALPRELSAEQCIALVRTFVRERFVNLGMVADLAFHRPTAADGQEHPHVHIMLTMRPLEAEGFGKKAREWNSHDYYDQCLADWEAKYNAALKAADSEARVDRRTLAEQYEEAMTQGDLRRAASLNREPEPYLGVAQRMRELTGRVRERFNQWVSVKYRRRLQAQQVALEGADPVRFGERMHQVIDQTLSSLGLGLRREPERVRSWQPEQGLDL